MKNKKLINSFKYAFKGIVSALLSERNMKIHVNIMALVIIFGLILNISVGEWFVCIICFAIVISAEMFNTAFEQMVDIAIKCGGYQTLCLRKDPMQSCYILKTLFCLHVKLEIVNS